MNGRRLLAAILSSVATVAAAAVPATTSPLDDYAYAWPLQASGDGAAWQVELTPEVYAVVTRADLGDVEVVNADGEAVAIALQPRPAPVATATIADASRPLPLFALPAASTPAAAGVETVRLHVQRDADGKLRSLDAQVGGPRAPAEVGVPRADASIDAIRTRPLLVDASALKAPLAALVIEWTPGAEPVIAQIAIDASDDLQQWRVVANAAVLRLVQDDHVLERHEIALDGIRAAYLRLRRLDDGPPLRGVHVAARSLSVSTPAQGALAWVAATPTADGDSASSTRRVDRGQTNTSIAYRYRLPAPLQLEALRVRLVDDNTLAPLTWSAGADAARADARLPQGRAVAFRLRQDDARLENDDFPFATPDRVRDLRFETPVPLQRAPTVSVAYRPDRLVFLAQGRGPYRLVAGSARRTRAVYPMATALAPLRAKYGSDWQPPLATIGPRATLQGESALVAATPEVPRDWRTWLLWAILVGAAAAIGGLALRLLRTPRDTPPRDS